MSARTTALYDEDFVAWTAEQAQALRPLALARPNLPLDLSNLAEEIENSGRRDELERRSRARRAVEHLLELEHSPVSDLRDGWKASIDKARSALVDEI